MGYDQARTAIEIGRKLDPDALEYHYSKYYLNDMLECYREKFALDDVIVRYLDQLAGERGYSNSNLLLLYHYLNTERNISLTAKRVHMHRNLSLIHICIQTKVAAGRSDVFWRKCTKRVRLAKNG